MDFIPLKDLGLDGHMSPTISPNWVKLTLVPIKDLCLLWSMEIRAPVSNFITYDECEILKKEMNLTDCNISIWNHIDNINKIISGNKAGPNGETLTWDELLSLYSRP